MKITMRTNSGTTVTVNAANFDGESSNVSITMDNAAFEIKMKDTSKPAVTYPSKHERNY
jgi:hypothetical protein